MKKLAEKEYWDGVYEKMSEGAKTTSFVSRVKDAIKYFTRDFSNSVIWEYLFPKYLPKGTQYKIIEIGCAPGKYLLSLKKMFGYEPYGVEYSEKGVSITRESFKEVGVSLDNVIQADFFDERFLAENSEKYDVVFSRGFIEHYDDVEIVVRNHSRLLKRGGYLVIMIPHLCGINGPIAKFFNIDSYNLHNVSIMNKASFSNLFPQEEYEHLYSDYVGIFSIGMFNTKGRWKYVLYRVLLVLQRPVDFLFRMFRMQRIRSKYTSPYLIFIGLKR